MSFSKKEHVVNGDGGHIMLNDLEARIGDGFVDVVIQLDDLDGKVVYELERGTNYIKRSDGVLIQWGKVGFGSRTLNPIDGFYAITNLNMGNFPIPFAEIPKLFGSYSRGANISWGSRVVGTETRTGLGLVDIYAGRAALNSGDFEWFAIGKW